VIIRRRSELDYLLYLIVNQDNEKHTHLPVILTNGCYDLLHYGHIKHLNNLKPMACRMMKSKTCIAECTLIVAVNTDASVLACKGHLPVVNFYAKGGDRGEAENLPEWSILQQHEIKCIIDTTEGSMRSSEIKRKIKDVE